jgi:hypothetical protein
VKIRSFLLVLAVGVSFLLASCHSSSTSDSTQTNVATYTLGGTVSGLAGTGLVLQDFSGNNLAVSANGTFTFAAAIGDGNNYSVTVLTQPSNPAQTCVVTDGSGTSSVNVTSVQVTCTNTSGVYTIGGTVSGLFGTGLVLADNGGNGLPVTASGSFTFTTPIANGGSYNVTVLAQPLGPAQTCLVTNGSGMVSNANVTNVQVTCTGAYSIGGTVSGLTGSGLVLEDNGFDMFPVSGNGSFTFATAIVTGGAYSVTVLTQPSGPAQTCLVTNGSGTVGSANVTTVQVTCVAAATYTIGGTISSLTGTGLVLQDNGGDNLKVSANGGFTFPTAIASAGTYNVTVLTQPSNPAQTCGVTNGSGTVASANVTNVQVTCATTTVTYTIGGTVINLAATSAGLQLDDNGSTPLLVTATGSFTFPTALASGSAYSVTVSAQPTSPAQTCEVTSGTGTATANVTSVVVDCGHGDWTWVSGAEVAGQTGIYGTQGMVTAGDVPGSRAAGATWKDAAGNFWLFGGYGYDSTGTLGYLNDLWEYSAGNWTWVSGADVVNQPGTYGSPGMAAAGNIPGSRDVSAAWIDASGNFWLFGGEGYDSAGTLGYLNDLWEYSGGEWIWVNGSDLANQYATYGTQGTAGPGNVPGARQPAVSWTDAAGNFWLFGGDGFAGMGPSGLLNELWKFGAGEWTYMGGSNGNASYGTEGMAAPGNIPGTRELAVGWTDKAGNFWLFGGDGNDSTETFGLLNDLWKYSGGEWTWVGGSNRVNQDGTYGTEGTAAGGNVPGARDSAVGWTDAAGNFWLFGGNGYGSTQAFGFVGDLWKYSGGEWTWMSGPNVVNQQGSYGTEGMAAPSNVPGARDSAVGWIDGAGNLWLFGGNGYDSAGTEGALNDLWMYEP